MPAEDRLLFPAGLCRIHAVTPPRPAPSLGCGLAPVGAVAEAAVALLNTGNPAVDENVVLGLVPVDHGRDDLLEIRRVLCRFGEINVADDSQPGVKACQLQGSIICSIAPVVPVGQALVDRVHFLVEIFMVPADEDHCVLFHELQNEPLHLHGFLPAVEQITQDDQLVRLGIGEIPRLIQRLMKFSIKAVNIGGDVIFHHGKS